MVEFGNARFQEVVDAYVKGDRASNVALSKVWTETTQGSVWQSPEYRRFFQTVRRSNRRFPESRKLRVLLGDPPVDLSKVDDARELDLWVLQRGAHFASIILREVVSQGRRGLVIAGVSHVVRRPRPLPTLTNRLEGSGPCDPDPKAVAKGINWCDDLRNYEPIRTFVIVPHRTFLGPAELREQLDSLGTPAILHVRKSELKELPLADVLGDTSEEDGDSWTAGEGFDAYLLGL